MIPIILVIVVVLTAVIAGWLPFGVFGTVIAIGLLAIAGLTLRRTLDDGTSSHL